MPAFNSDFAQKIYPLDDWSKKTMYINQFDPSSIREILVEPKFNHLKPHHSPILEKNIRHN